MQESNYVDQRTKAQMCEPYGTTPFQPPIENVRDPIPTKIVQQYGCLSD